MKGLFTKDLRLITQRKETFLLFIVMACFMGFALDGSFVVGYLTLLGTTLGIGTLSYDELDNGLMFLLTMPVNRKTYVLEKYIFGFTTALVSWLLGTVAYVVVSMFKNTPIDIIQELPGVLVYLPVMLVIMSVLLPVELKFGPEKSRVIMLIIFGAITVIAVAVAGVFKDSFKGFSQLAVGLNNFEPALVIGIMVIGAVAVCLLSLLLTVKILEHKEY